MNDPRDPPPTLEGAERSPPSRVEWANLAAPILALAGAALTIYGFFLPWLDGTGEFAARDFSGFDLARLVRNFEIVASSSSEEGQLRLTAALLYLVPALAANGAAFAVLPALQRWAMPALVAASAYVVSVLLAAGLLAAVSWTELEGVMGAAQIGYYLVLLGACTLGLAGFVFSRR